jgi:UDP-N-acetylglucosamine 2-epimerase (non-hydrolysing)
MNSKIKIMTIFGTRPEAIKMCPLVLELEKSEEIESIVTVTGQHRVLLDQVLDIFGVQPDYDLNIMKDNQTLTHITSVVLEGLDNLLKNVKPDLVLVHGDTTTTLAASLAAYYNHIKVGHVEAGLRTWNKYSPFPEEINRQVTGLIADLHFAPTEKAASNLIDENVPLEAIFITGNSAIDALRTTVKLDYSHELLRKIGNDRIVLLTTHRRENIGEPMEHIFSAVKRLVDLFPDIQVICPVHLNPKVREIANVIVGNHEQIQLIDPLGPYDFHNFVNRSHLILTDSGGVQEEAPSLGVPVVVLRDTTERPEGVEAGTLILSGTDEDKIFEIASQLLLDDDLHRKMSIASNPYGDGQASERIVQAVLYHFGISDNRPNDYLLVNT